MDRKHRLFKVTVSYDAAMMGHDQEAPGSGELVLGHTERVTRTFSVVATNAQYIIAWVHENPYKFPRASIESYESFGIDAVIEVHTY